MGVSETSRQAFKEVKEDGLPTAQRLKIYKVLEFANMPLTSYDIQNLLKIRLTSVLARINSLCESGCVHVSGKKTNPDSGKMNDAYMISGPYSEAIKRLSEKDKMRARIDQLEVDNCVLNNVIERLREKLEQHQGQDGQGKLF